MDPVKPPARLVGADNYDYGRSDESRWHHGGSTAKELAEEFGLYHARNKGLLQMHRGSPTSLQEVARRHYGSQSTHHKLLTYNTYLMDTTYETKPEVGGRAQDIGRMLGKGDYDIVCLNEVFNSDQLNILRDLIDNYGRPNWAEAAGPDSADIIGDISGGLFGFVYESGRKLIGSENEAYSDGGEGFDEHANKGWLRMEIDLGPGIADVFVTHTDAGPTDAASRKTQIKELTQAIQTQQRQHPDHVTVAVGDFNVYSSQSEYPEFLKRMWEDCSLRDVWLTRGGKAGATHAFSNTCTNSGPPDCACQDYNSNDYGGDRLDYIFVQDPQPQHKMNLDLTRVRRKPFPREKPCGDLDQGRLDDDQMTYMSDHLGLEVELIASPR